MSGSKAGPWITGTVLIAVVILVAAWFLGISPQLSAASESNEQATAQRDANTVLATKVSTLAEQFTHIEEYRTQLAASRVQIPTKLELAAYQRELNQIASQHSVVITSITVTASQPVTTPAAAEAPADTAATDDAAASDASAAESSDGAAPAADGGATTTVSGFFHVPVSIEVLGTYPNVLAFLEAAQTGTQRLLLVSGLTGSSQQTGEAGNGRPATAPGDLGLVLAGSLFVLQDQSTVPPAVDPNAAPAALPVPPADRNPLVPLP